MRRALIEPGTNGLIASEHKDPTAVCRLRGTDDAPGGPTQVADRVGVALAAM